MVGFIGAGRIAQAMARGFISSGQFKPASLTASDPNALMLKSMKKLGVITTNCNKEVVERSNVLILAIKPNCVKRVLNEVEDAVSKEKLIISIAAGVTIDTIEKALPYGSRVVRVMTNTPVVVQDAASVIATGTTTLEDDGKYVADLLRTLGLSVMGSEHYLDAVTGLSGSGPAYAFMAIEALADGGVKMGIPREMAYKLAAQALMGASRMVLETGKHTGQLKDDVCSPAGCTISAMHVLEKRGFRAALMDAVEVATARTKELGEEEYHEFYKNGPS